MRWTSCTRGRWLCAVAVFACGCQQKADPATTIAQDTDVSTATSGSPGPAAAVAASSPASVLPKGSAPTSLPARDPERDRRWLEQARKDLRVQVETICNCDDAACARASLRDHSIWEKELSLMEMGGGTAYAGDYVDSVRADPEIRGLRRRIDECAARIHRKNQKSRPRSPD